MSNNEDIKKSNFKEEYSINEILKETEAMSEKKEKEELKDNINKIMSEKAQANEEKHDKKKENHTSAFFKNILKKKKAKKDEKPDEIFSRNDKKIKTSVINPLDYLDDQENKKNQITFDEIINSNKEQNKTVKIERTKLSAAENSDSPPNATNADDIKAKASTKETSPEEKLNSKENLKEDKNEPENLLKNKEKSKNINDTNTESSLKNDAQNINTQEATSKQEKAPSNKHFKSNDTSPAKDVKNSDVASPKKIIRGKIKKSNNVIISDVKNDEAVNVIRNELFLYEAHKNISKNIRSVINKKEQSNKKFNIFGSIEEEDYQFDENTPQTEIVDDYTSEKDIDLIKKELSLSKLKLLIRLIITFITMSASVCVTVLFRTNLSFIQNSSNLSSLYLLINLISIVISSCACISVIINGVKSIIKMNGNTDTAITLAIFACILQIVLAYIAPNKFNPRSGLYLYACIALIGLFFNTLGKYLIVLRVKNNFKFLISKSPKYVAKICSDDKFISKITDSTQIKNPVIAYQSKTKFLSNFLKLSYSPDPCENLAKNIAPVGVILSILITAVEFIVTLDIFKSISLFAIISCMFIPMGAIVAANAQLYSFCKKALKHGTMLSGYPGIKQFAGVNSLIIDSEDLYKRGAVTLRGIKTFGTQKIDEGILYAAAVIKEVKGPLLPVFYQIINGRDYILPSATNIKYIDSKGIVAYVNSKRVLIGNRKLLEEHHISPKSFEYEQQYKKSGNEITYFAIEDELVAMFILSYTPDKNIASELQRLEYNGINIIVRTADPNITTEMIAKQFGLFLKTVNIIPVEHIKSYNKEKETQSESSRAYLATKGSISSFASAISSCVRIKLNIYLAVIIQAITVVLGVSIITLITFYAGLDQISPIGIIIYSLFWIGASIIAPIIRKP